MCACALVGSVESCSETKRLLNALKVVSLPALFGPLLLVGGDAPGLQVQVGLVPFVLQGQGHSGIVLWE